MKVRRRDLACTNIVSELRDAVSLKLLTKDTDPSEPCVFTLVDADGHPLGDDEGIILGKGTKEDPFILGGGTAKNLLLNAESVRATTTIVILLLHKSVRTRVSPSPSLD